MRVRVRASVLPAVLTLLLACGGDGGTGPSEPPAAVTVEPQEITLPQKLTRQLAVSVVNANGGVIPGSVITYASADSSMVTVSSGGLVTSVGPKGSTTITATSGGMTATVPVTVTEVPTSIESVPTSITLAQLTTMQLSVVVKDAAGAVIPNSVIIPEITAPDLIELSTGGLVTSKGPAGTGTIKFTAGTLTVTVPFTVTPVPTSLVVQPGGLVLSPAQTRQLVANVLDAVGAPVFGPAISYVANGGVVTVSASGLVTAGAAVGSGSISVSSGALTKSIPVVVGSGHHPLGNIAATRSIASQLWGVAVGAGGAVVVVGIEGTVSRANLPAFNFTEAPSGGQTLNVAIDGQTAYIAGLTKPGGGAIGVGVIDLTTNTQVGYLDHGDEGTPFSVTVSPDGQHVYMGTGNGNVVVFNTAGSGSWVQTISAGWAINHFAWNQNGSRLFASDFGDYQVYEIDAATNAVLRSFPVPGKPQGVAVSVDGSRLFVAREDGDIAIVDLASGVVSGTVTGSGPGFGLAISPDGQVLYMAQRSHIGGDLRIIDASTLAVSGINVNGDLSRVAFSPDGQYAVVVDANGKAYMIE
jgi:hypothetical protein